MPTTVAQILAFLVASTPGLVWIHIRERLKSPWVKSNVREIAEIVIFSALFDFVGVFISALIWKYAFGLDSQKFLATPENYFRASPFVVGSSLVFGVLVANGLAFIGAKLYYREREKLASRRSNQSVWVSSFDLSDQAESVETVDGIVLKAEPLENSSSGQGVEKKKEKKKEAGTPPGYIVSVRIDNEETITGIFSSLTDEPGLEGKRDIVLLCPMPENPRAGSRLLNSSKIVINEQRIRWMEVKKVNHDRLADYVRIRRSLISANPSPASSPPPQPLDIVNRMKSLLGWGKGK